MVWNVLSNSLDRIEQDEMGGGGGGGLNFNPLVEYF
jgi:hypothetical protein